MRGVGGVIDVAEPSENCISGSCLLMSASRSFVTSVMANGCGKRCTSE